MGDGRYSTSLRLCWVMKGAPFGSSILCTVKLNNTFIKVFSSLGQGGGAAAPTGAVPRAGGGARAELAPGAIARPLRGAAHVVRAALGARAAGEAKAAHVARAAGGARVGSAASPDPGPTPGPRRGPGPEGGALGVAPGVR